jgi:pyruvate/2-oxoglutarate dehydrogenase complex dihydrolipoamide acyltransferase (E2) component
MLAPAPQPAAPFQPAPAVAPASAPASAPVSASNPASAGRVRLALEGAGGKPLFALPGQRIAVRGVVVPFVGGQTVDVSFYRDRRAVQGMTVAVTAVGDGTGRFNVSFSSHYAGLVQARATHAATAQQGAFAASSATVRYIDANVAPGDRGASVRLLQAELAALRYAVPQNSVFDEATGRALIAYRKLTGLARVPAAGGRVWRRSNAARAASRRATPATGATSRPTSKGRCSPRSTPAGGCVRSTR